MYHFVKRLFDIIASLFALVVLSPIFFIAIIGIEISDPGPFFYMATRVGKDNQQFKMYKFRSMLVDINANEKNFKADSSRIFGWGKFMRDTKIDELPQLINILKGDMSIVGPRPASIDQVAITRGGEYEKVGSVKPGLSGPSALYDYLYGDMIEDESMYEELVLPTRLKLDLYYIDKMSCIYDLKIIAYTIICVVSMLFRYKPEKILNEFVNAVD